MKDELTRLGFHCVVVELGEVELTEDVSLLQRNEIQEALLRSGLELIVDKRSLLIQRIKNVVIALVHHTEEPLNVNFSQHLSRQLNYDYTYLANIFSAVQGITIERFIIIHKIERVKELLVNDQLNLTEIAYLMHYASVAHLSAQFKKITGVTASRFKLVNKKERTALDELK